MFKTTKINIEETQQGITPSTSFKDVTKKRRRNNLRVKRVASVTSCENETQENNVKKSTSSKTKTFKMTTDEAEGKEIPSSSTKNTETSITPKRERKFDELETPEPRTQTRLTLKYDDLLLSQTIDPQCEVSWECISPEVVQKIHRDIQRKPNLDISKILALLTDEDETPNHNSTYINTLLNARRNISCNKEVPQKRTLKAIKKIATSSRMEDMIKILEMQIKDEAKKPKVNDSMNCKSVTNTPQTLSPLLNTPSECQRHPYSTRNSSKKSVPDVCAASSSKTKTATPLNRSSNSCNDDTSWSDDDLFCDESFIAKVTQTSQTKTKPKKVEHASPTVDIFSDDSVFADEDEILLTSSENSSLGLINNNNDKHKERKSERDRELPGTSKSSIIVDAAKTNSKSVQQENNRCAANDLLLENDLDLGFSDSDTDELLSQLPEQEICCALKSSDKKVTKNISIENIGSLSSSATVTPAPINTVACKPNKKVSVNEKTSVDSFLEFLDLPSKNCRKPSPGKLSLKKRPYNFKSVKNTQTPTRSTPSTCSVPSNQDDIIISEALDDSFDDPFSDKDDDMLKFAESLDQTVRDKPLPEAKAEIMKSTSSSVPASKHFDPKAKIVCTKEEIERKKREALNRRKKLGAITKGNKK